MYFTYDRLQYHVNIHARLKQGIKLFRDTYEVPTFKPRYLVRVADMELVHGSDVNEHYCCLSYCLSQSGEITDLGKGKYERVDRFRHRYFDYEIDPETNKFDPKTRTVQYCDFETLIQEICCDHEIKYIWYDQMCVLDENETVKMREIKMMDRIFQNALFTIALLPELRKRTLLRGRWRDDNIYESQFRQFQVFEYCKRVWTVVEAYHSHNILFVGRDVHFYSKHLYQDCVCRDTALNLFLRNFGFEGNSGQKIRWTARQALGYLANCECRNPYDRVYALATIFPELRRMIKYNYKQNLEELETRFYRYLARQDPTILFFGNFDMDISDSICAFRRAHALRAPSWAGVNGAHLVGFDIRCLKLRGFNYEIHGDTMHINSTFVSIMFAKSTKLTTVNGYPLRYIKHGDRQKTITPATQSTLSFVPMPTKAPIKYSDGLVQKLGAMPTHLLPVELTSRTYHNTLRNAVYFCAALAVTEECTESLILTGLLFDAANIAISIEKDAGAGVGRKDGKFLPHELDHAYPVFGRNGDHYKAVGLAFFYPTVQLNKLEYIRTIRIK
ncbi:hypothetical protein BJV82DRAFT_709362 [Fennellomyces sp. T-0311]|nr:hypothetical protein BJV82DRAFT_709362 [Fennellomyces sp. T-0311]